MTSNSDSSTKPTTLLLCRHGESEWNAQRRIQGQSPDAGGLTALGRWQVQQLAGRLCAMPVEAVYSSDSQRAFETGQIIAAPHGLEPILDARWREADMGAWEGLTVAEVDARWPEERAAFRRGEDVARGGGETYRALQARVLAAIADLRQRHPGQTVAVACHGGPIYAGLGALLGYPFPEVFSALPPNRNANLTILQSHLDGWQALAVMDASHLEVEVEAENSLRPVSDRAAPNSAPAGLCTASRRDRPSRSGLSP